MSNDSGITINRNPPDLFKKVSREELATALRDKIQEGDSPVSRNHSVIVNKAVLAAALQAVYDLNEYDSLIGLSKLKDLLQAQKRPPYRQHHVYGSLRMWFFEDGNILRGTVVRVDKDGSFGLDCGGRLLKWFNTSQIGEAVFYTADDADEYLHSTCDTKES